MDPVFGPVFFGKLLTTTGQWILNVSNAIVTYSLTGDAFLVGLVSVAQFTPQLLLAPLSGRLADQGNPVRQIIAGRVITALGGFGTALSIWAVGGAENLPGAWVLIVTAFVVGLGTVLGGPAMQSIVPTLVRPNEIGAAVTLNSTPMTIARAVGPAAAAAIIVGAGPGAAFVTGAVTNLVLAGILLIVRIPARPRRVGTDFSIRAGLAYVVRDRPIRLLMVCTAAAALAAEPALTLAPALADQLQASPGYVGLIASSFGIGCGVGIALTGLLRRAVGSAVIATSGLLATAAALTAAAFATSQVLTLVVFGVCGAGMTCAFTSASVMIQQRVLPELRGRVMATWSMAFLGTRPISAALNGSVAEIVSVRAALIVTAGLIVAAAIASRPAATDPPSTTTH
ncbi:Predicted arabinose efflux permease, MFS family [Rhodococcoides kyotonense]|uniref:Predicted arabinose efflux permease, MFS family n=1 Tax=Rhodococcoides kyotonense TaxID=398843 RepID=A0A239N184_9NOCA|nr:Predicted arabinose efflux permease, MFS family [Rhodococcus kyotonensis]